MTALAEIFKLTVFIKGDRLLDGNVRQHVELVGLSQRGDARLRFLACHLYPLKTLVLLDDLFHLLLDLFQVFRRERLFGVKVVVKSCRGRRSHPQFRLGKQT